MTIYTCKLIPEKCHHNDIKYHMTPNTLFRVHIYIRSKGSICYARVLLHWLPLPLLFVCLWVGRSDLPIDWTPIPLAHSAHTLYIGIKVFQIPSNHIISYPFMSFPPPSASLLTKYICFALFCYLLFVIFLFSMYTIMLNLGPLHAQDWRPVTVAI